MNQVAAAFSAVHKITGISIDILILAIIFLVLGAYGFYFGKNKLTAFVLAFFPASLLYSVFPYTDRFIFLRDTPAHVALSKLGIFAVLFVLMNIVLIQLIHTDYSFSKMGKVFEVGILSLSAVIVIVAATHFTVPLWGVYSLKSGLVEGSIGRLGEFWTLAIALAGVYVGSR